MDNKHLRILAVACCLLMGVMSGPLAQENDSTPPDEDALIGVLQGDGDYMTHLAAFRGLRQIGTEKCIPVVAPFLHDGKKAHLARYVLEGMTYPAAGEALRNAIEGAPLETLPGIISSLAERRDSAAVSQLIPLMGHEDGNVSRLATAALGRIASAEAVQALESAHAAAQTDARNLAVAEALLAAAQNQLEDGNRQGAAKIYRQLRKAGNAEMIRAGAFYGLVKAAPGKTPERVIKSLQGKDPLFRNLARETIADTKGRKATEQYVAVLPDLSAPLQVEMLNALARRGDRTARSAVVEAVDSSDEAVKRAAIDALGELGTGKDVRNLAGLMADDNGEIATTARNSLIRLRGPKIDDAIVATMARAEPGVRARLLNILSVRISPEAVPQARTYLNDPAGEVRLAALNVFLQLGQTEDFDAVLAVMKEAADQEESELAARTLSAIARGNGEECLPHVLGGMEGAPEAVKVALVDALGGIGGPKALDAVEAQLDGSPPVRKKALDVLSGWPSQEAADTLLALAKSDDPDAHDAGLRGYTRLAQNHPEHDPKNAMMATAMELTRSKEEKWMVLSAYGNVHTGPALDALEQQLDDPEVQREAAMALLKVNEAIIGHGENAHPRVRKSLELLKSKVQNEYVQKKADELMGRLKK